MSLRLIEQAENRTMKNVQNTIQDPSFELYKCIIIDRNIEQLKNCIEQGADLNNNDDRFGKTALWQLITDNEVYPNAGTFNKAFELLIENGASIDINYQQQSIVDSLLVNNYVKELNYLIDTSKLDPNYMVYNSSTPILQSVISLNHSETAVKLIDKGASINPEDQNLYTTPLIAAIQNRNTDLIQLLIDKGANINPEGPNLSTTPLIAAAGNGNIELSKLLIDKGANINPEGPSLSSTPLIVAAENGNMDLAQLLIDQGASINPEGPNLSTTPLIAAVQNGNIDLCNMLIEKKANVNPEGPNINTTPLIAAVQNGNIELSELLIDNKANINQEVLTPYTTPLIAAARNGNMALTQLLIDKGANRDFSTPSTNIITESIRSQNIDMLELALQVRELPPEPKELYNGYLNELIYWQDKDKQLIAAQLLLDKGLDPNRKNAQGETIVDIIYQNQSDNNGSYDNNIGLFNLMIEKGAEKNPNLNCNPSWLPEIQYLVSNLGIGIPGVDTQLPNPNRFKKYFYSQDEKKIFLEQLEKKIENLEQNIKPDLISEAQDRKQYHEDSSKTVANTLQSLENDKKNLITERDIYNEPMIKDRISDLESSVANFTFPIKEGSWKDRQIKELNNFRDALQSKTNPTSYIEKKNAEIEKIENQIDDGNRTIASLAIALPCPGM